MAESRRLPLIVFVDNRLKRAFARHRRGLSQSFVPPSQEALFALYREASENVRTNWITFYSRLDDLRAAISTTLFDFDDSAFVTETIPDGTRVRPDTTFVKTWTIRNQGMVPWVDRFLAEVNSGASGLVPSLTRIPIPPTEPGVEAVLSVTFTTPTLPAIVESYWKMFHADGRLVWPDEIKSGIWCRVVVTLPGR